MTVCLVLGVIISFQPIYDRYSSIYILGGVPFLLATLYCFQGSVWQKTFVMCCIINAGVLSAFCMSPLSQYLAPYGSDAFYGWQIFFMTVSYLLEIILAVSLMGNFFPRLFLLGRKSWFLYTGGAILSRQILHLITNPDTVITVSQPPQVELGGLRSYYIVILASIWCSVSTCMAVVFTYRHTEAIYELKTSNEALAAARNHYQELTVSLAEAQKLRHDIKYLVSATLELSRKGDCESILRLFSNGEDHEPADVYCEHSVANALINWHIRRMKDAGIHVDTQILLPVDVPVDDGDLCVLLGNLLENAYEACLSVPADKRWVTIRIRTEPHMMMLAIDNSFDGTILLKGDKPNSLKGNGGFGLRSVRAMCEKYGGDFIPTWTHNQFTALALLNW
jgi:hypothetical protein